jgi:D-glycero-alpha-D-manno-heptose-7-phosphate kinase
MITSRTPLRISFMGGGSDYPQHFLEHGGAVLGGSIDKYCYVMLHNGQSWRTFDIPNKSGMASSSAYTVGLLRVCTQLDKVTIAQLATVWEQDKTGGMVGSQDQYLCSVGGFHYLKFNGHGIQDTPVSMELVKPLESYLMLFDTHQYRLSSKSISTQLARVKQNTKLLIRMAEMAKEGLEILNEKDYKGFGFLLHEAWERKRELSKYVSTESIDSIYARATEAGAIGGKLLGGGGGGFIIFVVQPEKQEQVKDALKDLTMVKFKFEMEGTKLIYADTTGETNI